MRTLLFAVLGLAAAEQLNPITRVAQLLEGLAAKVKTDFEAEQDLYDGFKCWCKKVVSSKSKSIDENTQRINELAAYIDDLSSGRVELTSERTTLEAEIKELEKAIEDEENMRDKEHADYLAAKDELDKSVAALQGAVDTMGDATTDMKEGVFLTSMHTKMQKVVKVGEGFLAQEDVQRLRKVLDVPDADWNKLNRDATFKMKYKQRSGEIQEILGEMLTTFTDNRNEAVAAEDKAVTDFTALMSSKNDQLTSAKDALLAKAGENGARGASMAESVAEKSELETQNSNDEKFISQTKASCETKASEWSERKRLRTEEQASIQQAIATLTSDDARDLFKRSFDSQGATFLQTHLLAVRKHAASKAKAAANVLRRTGVQAADLRLVTLASKVEKGKQSPTDFSAVTKDLEDMLADLVQEEKDDATEKEMCETERAQNNNKLHKLAKEIDTNTNTVDRLNKEIAAANKRIEESDGEIADLNKAQQDADDQRAKEATEYASAKADDKKAIEVLGTSMKVLQDFYSNNGLSFVQAPGEGGEAPTPPPTTWGSDGYGGASAETGGVIAMMENVKDDMKKDIAKADKDEKDAIKAYQDLTADITQSIKDLESTKGTLNGAIAADESSKSGEQTTRATNEDTSAAALQFLKSIANGCDYMMKNFEERKSNRQAEMDGLSKAKAIFAGADFS
jgi:hypothetical protein